MTLLARPKVLERLRSRFAYLFQDVGIYRAVVEPESLDGNLMLGRAMLSFVDQPHGGITSLGIRASEEGRALGYAIDFHDFTPEMGALYDRVDLWICDCLRREPHSTHAHLDAVLGWARELNVGQLLLTHLDSMDYATLVAELPDWAAPARRAGDRALMDGDRTAYALYLVLFLVLVASPCRRLPVGKTLKMAAAWVAIFALGFAIFSFRSEFTSLGSRLKAEAVGTPIQSGEELRIPKADDGHFWVEASVNGHEAAFMIDSGASVTTISKEVAAQSVSKPAIRLPRSRPRTGRSSCTGRGAEQFQVGQIGRADFPVL